MSTAHSPFGFRIVAPLNGKIGELPMNADWLTILDLGQRSIGSHGINMGIKNFTSQISPKIIDICLCRSYLMISIKIFTILSPV